MGDTPPTGTRGPPPRALPTLASVEASVAALSGQVRGARGDLEKISKEVSAIYQHLGLDPNVIRFSPVPAAPSSVPVPSSARPSKAAEAARKGGKAGQWLLVGTGALALLGQGLAMLNKPELGPIVAALQAILTTLRGGQ